MSDFKCHSTEIEKITTLLGSTVSKKSSVVTVTGAAGTGKTFLLRETAAVAPRFGYRTPLSLDGARLNALPPGAVPRGGSPDTPCLVLVDNAHLVTPERLKALIEATGKHADTAFLLAGRGATAKAADRWLRPGGIDHAETVHLVDLPSSATYALVTDLAGAPPDTNLKALASQTDGNPRWIEELITGLREERRLRVTGGLSAVADCRIPCRLRLSILRSLDRLSPPCRQMVQIAAAQGRVHPARTPYMLPLLEEAAEAAVLRPVDQTFDFQSVFVMRVVRETVPAPMRSILELEGLHAPGRFEAEHLPCPNSGAESEPLEPDIEQSTSRAPAAWRALTETERTIAQLVSRGLTNRQIAGRVFLSPHTVNYYLRRIFRKLGIVSRVELATFANTYDPRSAYAESNTTSE